MVVSPWPSKLTKAHVHGGEETGPVRGSARREDVGHYSITAADTVKEEETTTADGRRNRDDAGMADAVVYLVLAARPIRCATDRSLAATWRTSTADVMARDYRQCGPFASSGGPSNGSGRRYFDCSRTFTPKTRALFL
jgi:hypothetical protein